MDANKLDKLFEEKYRIPRNCALCKHGNFKDGQDYGTCNVLKYNHLKHSESERELSIHRFGRCANHHELDQAKLAKLGAWGVLLKE